MIMTLWITGGLILTMDYWWIDIDSMEYWWNDIGKGKSEAIPVQAWTGSAGSRRVRLAYFKTIGT